MREKIVYFLGAGFSAPLGLPVMANFLIRSKDLYFSDPVRYHGFENVFNVIESMAKAKNYYTVDLFNIEEILSLLEMEDYVGSSAHKQSYLRYLRDVVLDLTPVFTPATEHPTPANHLFTLDLSVDNYAVFAASLFRLDWILGSDNAIIQSSRNENAPAYGVISLNYDLILENSLGLICRRLGNKGDDLQFARTPKEADNEASLPFAKLHGSVEPLTIIPPTWNKVASEDVKESWRLAYRLLADATQIRFLGYSLPTTDNYVRYLLESAVLKSRHLKQIDVICRDDLQKTVESRFRSMITFHRLRFCSRDIRTYLSHIQGYTRSNVVRQRDQSVLMTFDKIELLHDSLMEHPA